MECKSFDVCVVNKGAEKIDKFSNCILYTQRET